MVAETGTQKANLGGLGIKMDDKCNFTQARLKQAIKTLVAIGWQIHTHIGIHLATLIVIHILLDSLRTIINTLI